MLKDAECFTYIYLRTGRTDMRLGIDGLLAVIGWQMELDPTEPGSIFLFCGHKKDRIKALIFEGDGWLLCYKRLTGDCSYQWPRDESEAGKLTKQQFRWLMEGLSIEQKKVIKDTYDNGSRSAAVIDRYLEGYKGILVSDGYASCHTLDRKHDDLKVAGCWVHRKRRYAEIVKTAKKGAALSPAQQIAREAAERIAVIFHMDNLSRGKSSQEIFDNRQQSVKPLVDAFFAWVKDILDNKIISSTDLKKALTYSVNQEKYLRVFLESAIIPLDNNDAERSIKKFCVGKHSWHIIDSKKGAKASAILYSIAETAKANGLNPFEYFKFLMEQLKEYPRNDVPEEELKKLMPWSETLPDCCKQLKKQS